MVLAAEQPNIDARVTLGALFAGFLKAALCGFGGGLLPWARRVIVEERRWMSEAEFADTLSLCQFLPGVNFANLAVCVGSKFRGLLGAVAAFLGLTLAPVTIVVVIGAGYLQVAHFAVVQRVLSGISGAAAGLVTAAAFRMLTPQHRHPVALLFAALAFSGIVLTHLPLTVVVAGLAPLSVGASWLRWRLDACYRRYLVVPVRFDEGRLTIPFCRPSALKRPRRSRFCGDRTRRARHPRRKRVRAAAP